eukprot:3664171-Pleurochrysis_carterae.AAC.1
MGGRGIEKESARRLRGRRVCEVRTWRRERERRYFAEAHGLIYVVDASESERFEARDDWPLHIYQARCARTREGRGGWLAELPP